MKIISRRKVTGCPVFHPMIRVMLPTLEISKPAKLLQPEFWLKEEAMAEEAKKGPLDLPEDITPLPRRRNVN